MYDEILRTASARKVCDGCEAIVLFGHGRCPECGAYRFREAVEDVVARVSVLREYTTLKGAPEPTDHSH